MSNPKLGIALIARDKFSHAVESLMSIINTVDDSAMVYVFDSGYPVHIKEELSRIIKKSNKEVSITPTSKYANTNTVWNQFVKGAESCEYLMCVENDVILGSDCINGIMDSLTQKKNNVFVPIVYETVFSNPHFNPTISKISRRDDGKIESMLDRGREDKILGGRQINHLERHCFAMSMETAMSLGQLDEQMWDRTDYDMSISCFVKEITIEIQKTGYVIFKPDPYLLIDRDFMDYRWNIDQVQKANDWLIEKWKLHGFKTTINHAHTIREMINQDQKTHLHYEPLNRK